MNIHSHCKINIKAIKFDEITVTFHPKSPRKPVINTTEKKQLLIGTIIQINISKYIPKCAIIKIIPQFQKQQYHFL